MEYKIVLEPDPEDGGYVVHCPALRGCYSQGNTKEEAVQGHRRLTHQPPTCQAGFEVVEEALLFPGQAWRDAKKKHH